MMMYGDNALEPELDDLGDEFAAACAAPLSMDYSQAAPVTMEYSQEFDHLNRNHMGMAMDDVANPSEMNMGSVGSMEGTDNIYQQIHEPLVGNSQAYPDYQQVEEPLIRQLPSQVHYSNPDPPEQHLQPHQQQPQYSQVMYQQQLEPTSASIPQSSAVNMPISQSMQSQHRQQLIMPVHRSQQQQIFYQQEPQNQRQNYMQHYPVEPRNQIVYVKRVAQPYHSQQVQGVQRSSQPQRMYMQAPQAVFMKPTQQVRMVQRPVVQERQPSTSVVPNVPQRNYVQRIVYPASAPIRQEARPVDHNLPTTSSTPEHISKMVDHGDYVIPSNQLSAAPSASMSSSNGHHDSVQSQNFPAHKSASHDHQRCSQETSVSSSTVSSSGPVDANNIVKQSVPFTGVYQLKPPSLPIPKKKKPEPPVPVVAATDVAQAAAMQRIGTEEGWRQMNTWLKSADKDNKIAHMRDLLKQCLQAKVSVDLLMSNDTPKFVRKLSKNHDDSEVKKTAGLCVSKWKKEIANPEVPSVKKEKKKPKDESLDYEDEEDKMSLAAIQQKVPGSPKQTNDDVQKAEKRRSADLTRTEKSAGSEDAVKPEKKIKAKARVYTAKSRLTGLEDLPDDTNPPDAKKKKSSVTPEKKAATPTKSKKSTPPAKKVSTQLSTGFMDALFVTADTKPKKKVQKKRSSTDTKGAVHDPSTTTTVLDGLFADQTKSEEKKRTPSPVAPLAVAEEPDMVPASQRKIRFADELGKDLVQVKEFEIEAGERINVNHMSPEDMKHHELMMERKFKAESGVKGAEEDGDSGSDPVQWRLVVVDGGPAPMAHGSKSEARIIELERQKHAMQAFNDPSMPCEVFSEPDDYDPIAARLHVPRAIPLDVVEEEEQEQPVEPVFVPSVAPAEVSKAPAQKLLPDNLQNLLDGLKKKGIVGGGPATGVSSLLSAFSGNPAASPTARPVGSAQPPQMGMPAGVRPQVPSTMYQQVPAYQQHGPIPSRIPPSLNVPSTSSAYVNPSGQANVDNMPAMPATPVHRMPGAQPGGYPGASTMRQCQFFKSGRGCHYGPRCKFAHGDQPPGNAFNGARSGYYSRGGPSFGGRGGFRGGRGQPYGRSSYADGADRTTGDPMRVETRTPLLNSGSALSPILSPTTNSSALSDREAIRIPSEPVERMDTTDSPASPS